jgi:uncharacterized membrane protein SirB2
MILGFAALGLCLAGALFAYDLKTEPTLSPLPIWMRVAVVVLCPGLLLFTGMDVDMRPHTQAFNEMWLIIALANCAIYTAIGAAIVGLRRMLSGRATDQRSTSR